MSKLTPLFVFTLMFVPSVSFAGGDDYNSDQAALADPHIDTKPVEVLEDTKTGRDPRLPPVLPGETVNRNGRKMKVWTTAGPVPVGDEPEPWSKKSKTTAAEGKDISVIIDKRHGRSGHNKPDVAENQAQVESSGE